MRKKLKIYLTAALFAFGVCLLAIKGTNFFAVPVQPTWSPSALLHSGHLDHVVGQTCSIFDERGNLVSKMARNVARGDEIINAEGQHYRVQKTEENRATAKLLGIDKDYLAWVDYFANLKEVPVISDEHKNRPVAIYQTHTDESYIPTDGTESKPFNGGILQVGRQLADNLSQNGAKILYSDNKHDPHDNNAYIRSRRTAVELMKQNPVALIDVHRDGIPDPQYYDRTVSGKDVTQIRLVVGKQNPKMQSNMDFAKRIMAYTNQKHPNLVKEIFIGKGNYNQDLMSTAMLIEAGTHTNKREQAQEGVALLADAVPIVLGVGAGAPPGPGAETAPDAGGKKGWSTLGWLVAALLIGGGAFLFISTGSLKGAMDKLSGLGKEFTSFIAPVSRKEPEKPKKIVGDEQKYDPLRNEELKDARDEITKD